MAIASLLNNRNPNRGTSLYSPDSPTPFPSPHTFTLTSPRCLCLWLHFPIIYNKLSLPPEFRTLMTFLLHFFLFPQSFYLKKQERKE